MRICVISQTYPRDISPGSGLVAYNLAKRVSGNILFIAKRFPGKYVESPPNVKLITIPYWEPTVPEDFGILRFLWIALGKSLAYLWFLARVAPFMVKFRSDLVHVHTILPLPCAMFAKFVLRRPVVMTFHGTDLVRVLENGLLQRLADLSVDIMICVSRRMTDELAPLLHNARVVNIPNGMDYSLFWDQGKPRKCQIIAVGALKWQKGYEYLLPAMQTLVARNPEVQLLIAGEGVLREELQCNVRSLGLEGNVQFLGSVSHAEVADRLNSSRVFVMSSVSEGLPTALLEAMACGTPVVVTDVGDCGVVAAGSGYVVPPRSPEALAEAIYQLLCDEVEWQKSSEQAVKNAQQYTWDKAAQRTVAVYEQLLSKSTPLVVP